MIEAQKHGFDVLPEEDGKRLDQVLAAHVPDLSRRRARVILDIGGVFVGGHRVKVASRPLRAGQRVEVYLGGAIERATKTPGRAARATDDARLPPFDVVYEDDDLIVVDKPSGLLVAPTPESDRGNLAGLLARREGQRERIFVVHRIDMETSGLLVLAKGDLANRALSELFRLHDIERAYLTVVEGRFPPDITLINRPIDGRNAVTHVEVLERFGEQATLLRCRLETGRTHQIRLHMQVTGHPVLGDRKYGRRSPIEPPRMALHATRLGFKHPRTGALIDHERPLPPDLVAWLDGLRRDRGA